VIKGFDQQFVQPQLWISKPKSSSCRFLACASSRHKSVKWN